MRKIHNTYPAELIERGANEHKLDAAEIAYLLSSEETEELLAATADRIRREFVGDGIHLRGLIEFSNICRQNCMYCGLRRDNHQLTRYRLSPGEILALARKAQHYGYRTVVLQSGEDPFYTTEILSPLLRQIKSLDMAITLSVGERTEAEYRELKSAGADRFLLRLETSDALLYERYDPGMSHANRLRCLQDLRKIGYEVGTGSLVGLPGQTVESLAQDILLYQELDADMLGIGPLIPNADTPLGTAAPGDFHLTRRMVSLLRLLLPTANIPATTAVETMQRGGREIFLASGANVVMPNVTEGTARQNYALYPGKACVSDTPAICRNCMETKIKSMGRFIATDKGFRTAVGRR